MNTVGCFIKKKMIKAGIKTQIELSKKVGISPGQISKILKGQANLTYDISKKLSDGLGFSLEELREHERKEISNVNPKLIKALSNLENCGDVTIQEMNVLLGLESFLKFPISEDSFGSLLKDYLEHQKK